MGPSKSQMDAPASEAATKTRIKKKKREESVEENTAEQRMLEMLKAYRISPQDLEALIAKNKLEHVPRGEGTSDTSSLSSDDSATGKVNTKNGDSQVPVSEKSQDEQESKESKCSGSGSDDTPVVTFQSPSKRKHDKTIPDVDGNKSTTEDDSAHLAKKKKRKSSKTDHNPENILSTRRRSQELKLLQARCSPKKEAAETEVRPVSCTEVRLVPECSACVTPPHQNPVISLVTPPIADEVNPVPSSVSTKSSPSPKLDVAASQTLTHPKSDHVKSVAACIRKPSTTRLSPKTPERRCASAEDGKQSSPPKTELAASVLDVSTSHKVDDIQPVKAGITKARKIKPTRKRSTSSPPKPEADGEDQKSPLLESHVAKTHEVDVQPVVASTTKTLKNKSTRKKRSPSEQEKESSPPKTPDADGEDQKSKKKLTPKRRSASVEDDEQSSLPKTELSVPVLLKASSSNEKSPLLKSDVTSQILASHGGDIQPVVASTTKTPKNKSTRKKRSPSEQEKESSPPKTPDTDGEDQKSKKKLTPKRRSASVEDDEQSSLPKTELSVPVLLKASSSNEKSPLLKSDVATSQMLMPEKADENPSKTKTTPKRKSLSTESGKPNPVVISKELIIRVQRLSDSDIQFYTSKIKKKPRVIKGKAMPRSVKLKRETMKQVGVNAPVERSPSKTSVNTGTNDFVLPSCSFSFPVVQFKIPKLPKAAKQRSPPKCSKNSQLGKKQHSPGRMKTSLKSSSKTFPDNLTQLGIQSLPQALSKPKAKSSPQARSITGTPHVLCSKPENKLIHKTKSVLTQELSVSDRESTEGLSELSTAVPECVSRTVSAPSTMENSEVNSSATSAENTGMFMNMHLNKFGTRAPADPLRELEEEELDYEAEEEIEDALSLFPDPLLLSNLVSERIPDDDEIIGKRVYSQMNGDDFDMENDSYWSPSRGGASSPIEAMASEPENSENEDLDEAESLGVCSMDVGSQSPESDTEANKKKVRSYVKSDSSSPHDEKIGQVEDDNNNENALVTGVVSDPAHGIPVEEYCMESRQPSDGLLLPQLPSVVEQAAPVSDSVIAGGVPNTRHPSTTQALNLLEAVLEVSDVRETGGRNVSVSSCDNQLPGRDGQPEERLHPESCERGRAQQSNENVQQNQPTKSSNCSLSDQNQKSSAQVSVGDMVQYTQELSQTCENSVQGDRIPVAPGQENMIYEFPLQGEAMEISQQSCDATVGAQHTCAAESQQTEHELPLPVPIQTKHQESEKEQHCTYQREAVNELESNTNQSFLEMQAVSPPVQSSCEKVVDEQHSQDVFATNESEPSTSRLSAGTRKNTKQTYHRNDVRARESDETSDKRKRNAQQYADEFGGVYFEPPQRVSSANQCSTLSGSVAAANLSPSIASTPSSNSDQSQLSPLPLPPFPPPALGLVVESKSLIASSESPQKLLNHPRECPYEVREQGSARKYCLEFLKNGTCVTNRCLFVHKLPSYEHKSIEKIKLLIKDSLRFKFWCKTTLSLMVQYLGRIGDKRAVLKAAHEVRKHQLAYPSNSLLTIWVDIVDALCLCGNTPAWALGELIKLIYRPTPRLRGEWTEVLDKILDAIFPFCIKDKIELAEALKFTSEVANYELPISLTNKALMASLEFNDVDLNRKVYKYLLKNIVVHEDEIVHLIHQFTLRLQQDPQSMENATSLLQKFPITEGDPCQAIAREPPPQVESKLPRYSERKCRSSTRNIISSDGGTSAGQSASLNSGRTDFRKETRRRNTLQTNTNGDHGAKSTSKDSVHVPSHEAVDNESSSLENHADIPDIASEECENGPQGTISPKKTTGEINEQVEAETSETTKKRVRYTESPPPCLIRITLTNSATGSERRIESTSSPEVVPAAVPKKPVSTEVKGILKKSKPPKSPARGPLINKDICKLLEDKKFGVVKSQIKLWSSDFIETGSGRIYQSLIANGSEASAESFSTLLQAVAGSCSDHEVVNKVLTTVGLNIFLHLMDQKLWQSAFTVYSSMLEKNLDPILGQVLPPNNPASSSRRLLLWALCLVYVGSVDKAIDHILSPAKKLGHEQHWWTLDSGPGDSEFRDKVCAEVLNSFSSSSSRYAMELYQYMMGNTITFSTLDVPSFLDKVLQRLMFYRDLKSACELVQWASETLNEKPKSGLSARMILIKISSLTSVEQAQYSPVVLTLMLCPPYFEYFPRDITGNERSIELCIPSYWFKQEVDAVVKFFFVFMVRKKFSLDLLPEIFIRVMVVDIPDPVSDEYFPPGLLEVDTALSSITSKVKEALSLCSIEAYLQYDLFQVDLRSVRRFLLHFGNSLGPVESQGQPWPNVRPHHVVQENSPHRHRAYLDTTNVMPSPNVPLLCMPPPNVPLRCVPSPNVPSPSVSSQRTSSPQMPPPPAPLLPTPLFFPPVGGQNFSEQYERFPEPVEGAQRYMRSNVNFSHTHTDQREQDSLPQEWIPRNCRRPEPFQRQESFRSRGRRPRRGFR